MATPIKNGVIVRILGEPGVRRTDYYNIARAAVFICSKVHGDLSGAQPDCDVTIGSKGMLREGRNESDYDVLIVPRTQVNWYNKPEDDNMFMGAE